MFSCQWLIRMQIKTEIATVTGSTIVDVASFLLHVRLVPKSFHGALALRWTLFVGIISQFATAVEINVRAILEHVTTLNE